MTRFGMIVPYRAHTTYALGTKDLVSHVSENIGNLLFRYAASKLVGTHVPIYFDHAKIDEYREQVDVLVYPTANQLNPSVPYLAKHATFFERMDKPLIMLGLGAQSPNIHTSIVDQLSPEAKRFFAVVSALSYKIGVRGPFTGRMLSEMGIDNWEVIGCPSQFINERSDLGKVIGKRFDRIRSKPETIARIAIFPQHGSSYMTDLHRTTERALFDYSVNNKGASYLVNGPSQVLALARGRAYETGLGQRQKIADFFMPGAKLVDFERTFRSTSTVFTTVESLMEYLSQCDLSLGKRIHGAFAANQSGIPAIVIAHDSRTRELAETTRTPFIDMNDFGPSVDVENAIKRVEFDATGFDKRRLENYRKTADIFQRYGHRISTIDESLSH